MINLRAYENQLIEQNYQLIGGCDEAGRGPLCGPLVAACVILPNDFNHPLINDSKKLTKKVREELAIIIKENAIDYQIEVIDNKLIDQINIYQASKLAMENAITNLRIKPDYILTDAMKLSPSFKHISIIKGDQKSISIASASILAKTYRDQLMLKLSKEYPQYGFDTNQGYPTKKHIEAINQYGITKYHRRTFSPIKELLSKITQLELDL